MQLNKCPNVLIYSTITCVRPIDVQRTCYGGVKLKNAFTNTYWRNFELFKH